MRKFLYRLRNLIILCFFVSLLSSCILDEFKVSEMKEDWNFEVVTPLFYGNIEFKDLIYNSEGVTIPSDESISFLKFPEGLLLEIPTQTIFEHNILVDEFALWVNGNNNFTKINLKYTVSNGAPFPLNFQMRFSDGINSVVASPAILPPPFLAAEPRGQNFVPTETIHVLPLNLEQVQSFVYGEMVQFETWFNTSDLVNSKDTFLSNYPVKISIILYGEIDTEI